MKKLFIIVIDGMDGSYYPHYIFDETVVKRLEDLHNSDELDYEDCYGADGDGFHYETLTLPDEVTAESLGITRVITHEDIDNTLKYKKERGY